MTSPGRTTWGAGVRTAIASFEGAVSDLAYERTRALLTEEEFAEEFRMEQEAVFENGEKIWRFKFPGARARAAWGGLTFLAYLEKLKAEIRAQEPPVVHACFQISPDHGYIDIVVDALLLDRAAIEQAILRFRALGEKDWTSPDPVPLDRLLGEGGQAAS